MQPGESEQEYLKCNQCGKFFVNSVYLGKHYLNKHPHVNYLKDTARPTTHRSEAFKTAEAEDVLARAEQKKG